MREDAPKPAVPPQPADAMMVCPTCSAPLQEIRCKLVCPQCGYFLSCADFY